MQHVPLVFQPTQTDVIFDDAVSFDSNSCFISTAFPQAVILLFNR